MCGTYNLPLDCFCNTKQSLQGEKIGAGQHKSFQSQCLRTDSFSFDSTKDKGNGHSSVVLWDL